MHFYSVEFYAEIAKTFNSTSHELLDIDDKAHQPKSLLFQKCKFGIKVGCFQCEWFTDGSIILAIKELSDSAFCLFLYKGNQGKETEEWKHGCLLYFLWLYTNWKLERVHLRHKGSDVHKVVSYG